MWRLLYRRWRARSAPVEPGYTLLLPVPSDLPVFAKLALAVCARQSRRHLVEALIVPDDPTPEFAMAFADIAAGFPELPVRMVTLPWRDRRIVRQLRNGHNNYFLQFMRGVEAARGSHVLLHDADAFLHDPEFLDRIYSHAGEHKLVACGVNQVWDDWYRENGYPHVTATWELLLDTEWVREFKPFEHRGHYGAVDGKGHEFDATLLPQCRTEPQRVGRTERTDGFVHFNYVIVTYRKFLLAQRDPSVSTYEDSSFRLLLIRLLHDAFASPSMPCAVPSLEHLARGLDSDTAPVTYRSAQAREYYPEYRRRFEELLTVDLFDAAARQQLRAGLVSFDAGLWCWRSPRRQRAATQSSNRVSVPTAVPAPVVPVGDRG